MEGFIIDDANAMPWDDGDGDDENQYRPTLALLIAGRTDREEVD